MEEDKNIAKDADDEENAVNNDLVQGLLTKFTDERGQKDSRVTDGCRC